MLAQVASEANGQVATVLYTLDSSLALRALAQHGALDAWEEILAHEIVSQSQITLLTAYKTDSESSY